MRRVLFIAAVGLVVATAGCGSGGGGAAANSSTSTSPASAHASTALDPNFAFGQTVLITRAGIRPHWLVSVVGRPIVWRNQTGRPQRIVFDHQDVRSPMIAPGGAFTYRPPTALSIAFHSVTDPRLRGIIQVTPTGSQ